MSVNNSISARIQRLNKLILSSTDGSNVEKSSKIFLNRETLLDAFDVLFNQCNKDALKKTDRNISDFGKKCNIVLLFCCLTKLFEFNS